MSLSNFFSKFINKTYYNDNDKFALMQILKKINRLEDMIVTVRYLNYCSDIYKDEPKYTKTLFGSYCKIFKNVKIDNNYFFNNIDTITFVKMIRELLVELGSDKLDTNNTSVLVNNINYIIAIIYRRDHFKIIVLDYLTKGKSDLFTLLSVMYLGDDFKTISNNLYKLVYKDTEYDNLFLTILDTLNKR